MDVKISGFGLEMLQPEKCLLLKTAHPHFLAPSERGCGRQLGEENAEDGKAALIARTLFLVRNNRISSTRQIASCVTWLGQKLHLYGYLLFGHLSIAAPSHDPTLIK